MTTATAAQSRPGLLVAGAERTTGTLLAGLYRLWSDHRRYRTTLAELGGLTEKQLADIGLGRGDIRSTARLAVYGKQPVTVGSDPTHRMEG